MRGAPDQGASVFSIARMIASCASRWPRKSSIIAPDQICAIGFAIRFPAAPVYLYQFAA